MTKDWAWDPPRLERLDLADRDGFQEFRDRYLDALNGGQALNQILAVIGNSPKPLCYVERDYVDRDYRDEYSNFYAGTFRSLPDRCQRLHFVSKEGGRYLGFVVLRPIPGRLVCRTMVAPPPALKPFTSCLVTDVATLYGIQQAVEASPFISQDFQYGVCAHASIWMVAQYFNLRFGFPRLHMSDIVQAAGLHPGNHRMTPSRGLTAQQISGAMDRLGMLPLSYHLPSFQNPDEYHEIIRIYLNSRIPLLLTRGRHVHVLIGYFHDDAGKRTYIAHDDIRGPYQLLNSLEGGERLLVPSPGRIYLEAPAAERAAHFHFTELMEDDEVVAKLVEDIDDKDMKIRAYLTEINAYRKKLGERGLSDKATSWLRMSAASHWVWVVELQDQSAAGTPDCVIGEMVVDATTDERHPHVLFGLMPGVAYRWSEPRRGREARQTVDQLDLFRTGCAIHSVA